MHDIWMDVRIAMRRLRHSPGFVLVALLSLTMAIAANLVVFGVTNAAILRPLNVANADRLWMVVQKPAKYISQSYPDYLDYRARNTTFSDMAAYRFAEAGLSTQGIASKRWSYEVSANYFDMLGVQPELGRLFHANEEHGVNSMPYVVLSDWFWRSRFGGDPGVVGKTVDLNKHPFTVIGVAPAAFHGTELMLWPDFWIPTANEEQIEGYSYIDKRFNHGMWVVGLLKPGVTPQQATQNLNAIAAQLAKQ
jgi:hypothetical protein